MNRKILVCIRNNNSDIFSVGFLIYSVVHNIYHKQSDMHIKQHNIAYLINDKNNYFKWYSWW